MIFEWNEAKARTNLAKHGISFDEASTVFGDPLSVTVHDPLHSRHEDRFVTVGVSVANKMLVIVHVDRGQRVRIISARTATPQERRQYEDA